MREARLDVLDELAGPNQVEAAVGDEGTFGEIMHGVTARDDALDASLPAAVDAENLAAGIAKKTGGMAFSAADVQDRAHPELLDQPPPQLRIPGARVAVRGSGGGARGLRKRAYVSAQMALVDVGVGVGAHRPAGRKWSDCGVDRRGRSRSSSHFHCGRGGGGERESRLAGIERDLKQPGARVRFNSRILTGQQGGECRVLLRELDRVFGAVG